MNITKVLVQQLYFELKKKIKKWGQYKIHNWMRKSDKFDVFPNFEVKFCL